MLNGTLSDPLTEIYWSAYHLKMPFIIVSTVVLSGVFEECSYVVLF